MEHKLVIINRFKINELHGYVEKKSDYFRIVAIKNSKTYECFLGRRRILMTHEYDDVWSLKRAHVVIEETEQLLRSGTVEKCEDSEQLLRSGTVEKCEDSETNEIIVLRFVSKMRIKNFKLSENTKKDPIQNMLMQILDRNATKIMIGDSKEYGNFLYFSDINFDDFTNNKEKLTYTGSNEYYKILEMKTIATRVMRNCLCIMSSWMNIGGNFFDLEQYVNKIMKLFAEID
jgi:hypothetical protein